MLDRQPLRLPAALREYLREEATGGIVLMAAAAVALAWASSPATSSRLISRPTTRKNRVMRPSLTQWRRSVWRAKRPSCNASGVAHRAS